MVGSVDPFASSDKWRFRGTVSTRTRGTAPGTSRQRCKGRVHFVVVFNLTRFARDKYDHFALRSLLQSLGISLRSATEPIYDTSTGKLMEGVLAAFAQFDNDCRSDRTRAGMKTALELGRWVFLAPLGYLNAARRATLRVLRRRVVDLWRLSANGVWQRRRRTPISGSARTRPLASHRRTARGHRSAMAARSPCGGSGRHCAPRAGRASHW